MPSTPRTPAKRGKRAPYRMVSSVTWELARAAYLGGETAEAVARRFGIGLQNLRQTIHRKGWSKRALADARAATLETLAAADPDVGDPSPSPDPGPIPATAPPMNPTLVLQTLLDVVMVKAGEAILKGAGAEATALIRAAREWVILTGEILTTRAEVAELDAALSAVPEADRPGVLAQVTVIDLKERWTTKG